MDITFGNGSNKVQGKLFFPAIAKSGNLASASLLSLFTFLGSQPDVYGGILVRAIERVRDGKLFEGPCVTGAYNYNNNNICVLNLIIFFLCSILCLRLLLLSLPPWCGKTVNRLLAHAGVKEVEDLVSLPSFDFEVGNSGAEVLRRKLLYLHFLDGDKVEEEELKATHSHPLRVAFIISFSLV